MAPTIGDLAVNFGKIVNSTFLKNVPFAPNVKCFSIFGYDIHHITLVKVGNTDVPKRGTFTS